MHLCMYACMHICMQVCLHLCMYTYIHVCRAMINLTASHKFKVHEINTMLIFSILTSKNIPVYYKVHTCLLGIMRAHVRFLHHAIFSKWIAMTISAYDEEFSQCRIIQKFFEYIKVFFQVILHCC